MHKLYNSTKFRSKCRTLGQYCRKFQPGNEASRKCADKVACRYCLQGYSMHM